MSHLFDKDDFWTRVNNDINQAVYRSTGMRLTVSAIEGSMIRLEDSRGESMGLAPYAGFERVVVGDDVWVEPVARLVNGSITRFLSWVVLGVMNPGSSAVRSLDGQSLNLVGGMDLSGSANEDGSSVQWTIDGATGNAAFGTMNVTALNTPIFFADSQTGADDSATSSTTLWSNAMSYSLALPSGTWTVTAVGIVPILHSTSSRGHVRVEIDGDATGSEANSPSAPSATPSFRSVTAVHVKTGIAGNRSITVKPQFKSLDAGTTTPNNPLVFGSARRTS